MSNLYKINIELNAVFWKATNTDPMVLLFIQKIVNSDDVEGCLNERRMESVH